MWAACAAFGRALPGDVRVVVVRGRGPGLLRRPRPAGRCARGGAPASVADAAARAMREHAHRRFQEAFAWLRRPSLITIAAVQGHAIGAGFQLALACDFRVVAEDAKFCMAEVTLGLVPDLGGTKRLVELVGYARALELCVTGRRVRPPRRRGSAWPTWWCRAPTLDDAVSDLTAAVLAGRGTRSWRSRR